MKRPRRWVRRWTAAVGATRSVSRAKQRGSSRSSPVPYRATSPGRRSSSSTRARSYSTGMRQIVAGTTTWDITGGVVSELVGQSFVTSSVSNTLLPAPDNDPAILEITGRDRARERCRQSQLHVRWRVRRARWGAAFRGCASVQWGDLSVVRVRGRRRGEGRGRRVCRLWPPPDPHTLRTGQQLA